MDGRYNNPVKKIALPFLLLLLFPAGEPGGVAAEAGITLYYSASLNGNLDGCVCQTHPRAGLVKRAAFLRSLPDPSTSLLLELGDIFDTQPDPDLERHILDVYRELGYTAIAVGDQELAGAADARLNPRDELPLLCGNLTVRPQGAAAVPFSAQPLILERGGMRIGIFALLDPEALRSLPRPARERLQVEPPEAAAVRIREGLAGRQVALAILLYHGPYERARRLLRRVPGIDVLLVGHEQRLIEAHPEGRSVVASPGEEGNHLGILHLSPDPAGKLAWTGELRSFRYAADPDDPAVRKRIQQYREALYSRLRKP
jgi:2',3'-cyclic-nucleotide 2'-phosphodiesterase (5'-nucleotidase family)